MCIKLALLVDQTALGCRDSRTGMNDLAFRYERACFHGDGADKMDLNLQGREQAARR